MRQGWDIIRSGGDVLAALEVCPDHRENLASWIELNLPKWGVQRNEAVRRSRLNSTFAYQILAGTRHASRDKLIQLAFGLRLGIDDACELLERGGVNALNPTAKRDVVLAWCLHNGLDIARCDDLLWSLGEKTLMGSEAGR